MKNLIALLVFTLTSFLGVDALAAIRPYYQDIKLPTQKIIEHQNIDIPMLASTGRLKVEHAGPTSAAAASITTFIAQPDVPRNLTITPAGTTTDIESCVITVTGTDFHGASLSETFTFAANASSAVTGNKAFKTVSSVAFPANCESGGFAATWSVGIEDKLGLKRCLANAGDVVFSTFDGAYETTRGTVAVNASSVASNTFNPNGTLDGAKDVDVYFFQNYAAACQP